MHAHAQATARKRERARTAGDPGADDRDVDCSLRPGVRAGLVGSASQNGVRQGDATRAAR